MERIDLPQPKRSLWRWLISSVPVPSGFTQCAALFDDAREIPLHDLISCQVGPYYTNTKAGLALAQRFSPYSERKQADYYDHHGKPSAIWHQGQIVRHSVGPLIIARPCARQRMPREAISINTFMLARDYALMEFVHKQTQITRAKLFHFTTDSGTIPAGGLHEPAPPQQR